MGTDLVVRGVSWGFPKNSITPDPNLILLQAMGWERLWVLVRAAHGVDSEFGNVVMIDVR